MKKAEAILVVASAFLFQYINLPTAKIKLLEHFIPVFTLFYGWKHKLLKNISGKLNIFLFL